MHCVSYEQHVHPGDPDIAAVKAAHACSRTVGDAVGASVVGEALGEACGTMNDEFMLILRSFTARRYKGGMAQSRPARD